jgi:hypothetical protein
MLTNIIIFNKESIIQVLKYWNDFILFHIIKVSLFISSFGFFSLIF